MTKHKQAVLFGLFAFLLLVFLGWRTVSTLAAKQETIATMKSLAIILGSQQPESLSRSGLQGAIDSAGVKRVVPPRWMGKGLRGREGSS